MSPISLSSSKAPQLAPDSDYDHLGRNIPYCAVCAEFCITYVFCRLSFCCSSSYFASYLIKKYERCYFKDLGAGSAIGLVIAAGYGTQTIGLQTIPSSESAFFNGAICSACSYFNVAHL